jgi:hypothetical protein
LALFGSEMLRSRFPTLQPARSSLADRLSFGLAYGVLSFTNGNIEHLLGKLGGIARTFCHGLSIAQAAL